MDLWILFYMFLVMGYNILLVASKTRQEYPGEEPDILIDKGIQKYMSSETSVIFSFATGTYFVIYFLSC